MTTTRFELVQKKTRKDYKDNNHRGIKGGIGTRRFVAIDGEGLGDKPDQYVLLGVGQDQYENPNGIEWKEAFQFLYSKFLEYGPRMAYVGFYLGYDFTQILKSLPEERARMLLSPVGRAKRATRRPGRDPFPVEYQGWQFDILGMKRLKIRPKMCHCRIVACKCPKASWMYICDAGGFWQSSFMDVIDPEKWPEPIVSREEYEIIKEGKDRRNSASLDDEMRFYNRLENEVLERAMGELSRGFEQIGLYLTPRQWFGPGQAAAKWLDDKLPKRAVWMESVPDYFLEAAIASYYGGWFEVMVHGVVDRDVHEYDINSAYPAVIRGLPCLVHGKYSRGYSPTIPETSDLYLVRSKVSPANSIEGEESQQCIGAMLHRDSKGNISRPLTTEGWYWYDELVSAQSAGCFERIEIREWMRYERPECKCRTPLRAMEDLYRLRIQVGKDTPLGKACKLVYNSAYGKFAQSVGIPKFGNPIYASLITSGCRTLILQAIASHPDKQKAVAMVATDAVFFLSEHPNLKLGKELGEWSHETRQRMTLFKPGVYWDQNTRDEIAKGEKPKFKARGINAKEFGKKIKEIDHEFMLWMTEEKHNAWPEVSFPTSFSMTSLGQALQRDKWQTAGNVRTDVTLHQASRPLHKRRPAQYFDEEFRVFRSKPWTQALSPDMDWISHPYKKRFGLDDPFSEDTRERYGITDDGTVSQLISGVLRN